MMGREPGAEGSRRGGGEDAETTRLPAVPKPHPRGWANTLLSESCHFQLSGMPEGKP